MSSPLLEIRGLRTEFATDQGTVASVEDVSITVNTGETVALVGESGSGKTVTAHSILQLIPMPPGRIAAGQILWKGTDLVGLKKAQLNRVRAKEIAVVFQEPMTSLNPVYSVGEQIAESVRLHDRLSRSGARKRAIEMLEMVRIPNAARRVDDYPHQFSGGMRQRVMIAMALACNPQLLIADEPTTALDVTIQAQILDLLQDIKEQMGMAVLLITHDMGVVAETAQKVVVMYAGRVVEEATVEQLFDHPRHPYTQGLIRSIPQIYKPGERKKRLTTVPGVVPSPLNPPPGCRFAPRCPVRSDACRLSPPVLVEGPAGHKVACIHQPEETAA